jgi:N-acetylglucosamine-6-phosphate deacetylase
MAKVLTGAAVFDGNTLHRPSSLRIDRGRIAEPGPGTEVRLDGGFLVPGFLDLQVNGGGGRMVDGETDLAGLSALCDVHARLGSTGILPTLITDRPEVTRSVIKVAQEAAQHQVSGFLGLHLEGPHLDPRRKGAHDPALIRPMTEADLSLYLEAAAGLPSLMVTLAPESVTLAQIRALAEAGVIVSLGHSDCSSAEAKAAIAAGAHSVTHLFNAMSQLGGRTPGLVGAALVEPVFAGLIADGHHVAPDSMRVALGASDRIFLVSDAMATAGSPLTEFLLNGRRILRRDGRLTLADGTLAGADLTMIQAVQKVWYLGLPIATALAMATIRPAQVLRRDADLGHLMPGARADFLHLGPDLSLQAVWRAGERIG